jgi:hypothetical protein
MAAKKDKAKPEKKDESEKKEGEKRYTVETVETEEPLVEQPPEPPVAAKKSKLPFILLIIFVFLLGAAVGAGLAIYQNRISTQKEVSSEPTVTEVPTPTPTPILERKDLNLEVLNGAGVAGTAAKAKAFLEEKGYVVAESGNADNFNFTETTISIKDSKKEYLMLLTDDLSENYTVASESSALSEDSEFDAVVTIGK